MGLERASTHLPKEKLLPETVTHRAIFGGTGLVEEEKLFQVEEWNNKRQGGMKEHYECTKWKRIHNTSGDEIEEACRRPWDIQIQIDLLYLYLNL